MQHSLKKQILSILETRRMLIRTGKSKLENPDWIVMKIQDIKQELNLASYPAHYLNVAKRNNDFLLRIIPGNESRSAWIEKYEACKANAEKRLCKIY